jgi:arginine-tRNA-protein transferase
MNPPAGSSSWREGLMSSYDEQCAEDFRRIRHRIEPYFVDLRTACPYGLPFVATFHQAMLCPIEQRVMELFLAAGYRRNGNCLYTMHCADCAACIPIRLDVREFRPNRNQRRVQKKNVDVVCSVVDLVQDRENLDLCQKFLARRYPQKNNTAEGYYQNFFLNGIVDSRRIEMRLAGRLIGASIADIGRNWVNAVYFYFDPDESSRSLGTSNIITLVDLCRKWGINYIYLGYYIREVAAMSYKTAFKPHALLEEGRWRSYRS